MDKLVSTRNGILAIKPSVFNWILPCRLRFQWTDLTYFLPLSSISTFDRLLLLQPVAIFAYRQRRCRGRNQWNNRRHRCCCFFLTLPSVVSGKCWVHFPHLLSPDFEQQLTGLRVSRNWHQGDYIYATGFFFLIRISSYLSPSVEIVYCFILAICFPRPNFWASVTEE